MNIKRKHVVLLFFINLLIMGYCVGFRKNDYITGALLLVYVFTPLTIVQSIILSVFYIERSPLILKWSLYLIACITVMLIIFLGYFVTKGR
jgi:hypothetical protein